MDEMTAHELEKKCERYRNSLSVLLAGINSFEKNTGADLSSIKYDIEQSLDFMKRLLDADVVEQDSYDSFLQWFSFPEVEIDEENFIDSLTEVKKDLDCRMEGYRGMGILKANERMRQREVYLRFDRWLEASCLNPSTVRPATAYLPAVTKAYYEYEKEH